MPISKEKNAFAYEKRSKRTIDVYGYEDDIFEQFHEMTSLADCPFVLWVGNRRMIKRRIFDEYIEQMYSI